MSGSATGAAIRASARRAVPWALERVLLPLSALLLTYLLGFIGLLADPSFPYDPGRFAPGTGRATVALAVLAARRRAGRPARPTAAHAAQRRAATLAAVGGLLCVAAVIGIWITNPFMALLLTPLAHIWLLPARAQGPRGPGRHRGDRDRADSPAAVTAQVASSFEIGLLATPWHLLLLIGGGQIGLLDGAPWCLLLGGLIACIAACRAGAAQGPIPQHEPIRGPGGYPGSGPLRPASRFTRT